MKALAPLLATLLATMPSLHAQALKLVGTPDRGRVSTALPVQSGEAVTMEMLLMPGTDRSTVTADLVQIAGTVAAPLQAPVAFEPSPLDPRLTIVRFTAPHVARITRLRLQLSDQSIWPIVVFPPEDKRDDRPDLAGLLKSTRQQLLVCGRSRELREHLDQLGLRYEDLGIDAPRSLRGDQILIGELPDTDAWKRLAAPDADGRLIVSVDDPSLLPGVHSTTRESRYLCKITLPLFQLLPDNPQARETLFQLLLAALAPAPR